MFKNTITESPLNIRIHYDNFRKHCKFEWFEVAFSLQSLFDYMQQKLLQQVLIKPETL